MRSQQPAGLNTVMPVGARAEYITISVRANFTVSGIELSHLKAYHFSHLEQFQYNLIKIVLG